MQPLLLQHRQAPYKRPSLMHVGRSELPRSNIVFILLYAVCFVCGLFSNAQAENNMDSATDIPVFSGNTQEIGMPFMRSFTAKDHGRGAQNWTIAQDPRGLIYIGNQAGGILEFDGVRWRFIPITRGLTARSLAVSESGRIYVGAVSELGYLEPDESGLMRYVSMVDQIPESEREFADVWKIYVTKEAVYFGTFSKIFRFQNGKFTVLKPQSAFHFSFFVNGHLYVRDMDQGLKQLVDDEFKLIPGGEIFAHDRIYVALPWRDKSDINVEKMLLGTRNSGWFIFDGKSFIPWFNEVDAALKNDLIYQGIWLSDGRIAVATLLGGVYLLDRHGKLLDKVDKQDGLPGNDTTTLFQDIHKNLWICTGAAISIVDIESAFSYFNDHLGLDGTVNVVLRHQDKLYAGSSVGLYQMETPSAGNAHFVPVDGITSQSWALLSWGPRLLAGNYSGLFELENGHARKIASYSQAVMSLVRSSVNSSRLFVGTGNGLVSLHYDDGQWVYEGRLNDVTAEIRSLRETNDGTLWLGTVSSGVYRIGFRGKEANLGVETNPVIEHFDTNNGLPEHNIVTTNIVGGKIVFTTPQGLYTFEESNKTFVPFAPFANLFPEQRRSIDVMAEGRNGRMWMGTSTADFNINELGSAIREKDGHFQWESGSLGPLQEAEVEMLYAEENGVVWIGGADGLNRYDSTQEKGNANYTAIIRKVSDTRDKIIFGGAGPLTVPVFDHANNSLRFEFSAISYAYLSFNRFQVMLEGVDTKWSSWSKESYRDYTNLAPGNYRFIVHARNVYGEQSADAIYRFQILAPWYRQWWAYLLYVLLSGLIVQNLFRWRLWALNQRNRLLELEVAERTRELNQAMKALEEQSLTDPLTGLRNRRFLSLRMNEDIAEVNRSHQIVKLSQTSRATLNIDLVFVMVDLDHFKSVNDEYGHAAGDHVLEQTALLLNESIRDTDTVVRWGGEEFLVVARKAFRGEAGVLAERIRSKIEAHEFDLGNGQKLRRTCSLGLAIYPFIPQLAEAYAWEQVVDIADQCLYAAKRAGRNAWVGLFLAENSEADAILVEQPLNVSELIAKNSLVVKTSLPAGTPLDWSHGRSQNQ